MSPCPNASACTFSASVEPYLVKRIRFASAFPYCKGGKHDECALYMRIRSGDAIPANLLPDGSFGDYREDTQRVADRVGGTRILVVDDSPIFATIAANTARLCYPGAEVLECHSFEEAEPELRGAGFSLIVSGNGLGGGRSVHDVRRLSMAPIVLFTGMPPAEADTPAGSRIVTKGAGPEALRHAMEALLA